MAMPDLILKDLEDDDKMEDAIEMDLEKLF